MFKKPFQTKARTPVRSSNCRRLVQESKEGFPTAWESTPMPSKLQTAKFVSHIGDKGDIFYSEAGNPLWVKAELPGSNAATLAPTVYTLWDFPSMLPILWTWQPVVKKLIGGADLMVPGLIVPKGGLPALKRGALVAICCPGSVAAQAVGVLAIDTKDIRSVAGAKGKAVLIMHTYKDHLWEAGSKSAPPETLQIAEDLGFEAESAEASSLGVGDDDAEEEEEDEPAQNTPAEITAAEMDALLMETLKQAMATVLDEKTASSLLPINSSAVYSHYIVPNAPYGVDLDIKKSTYKKLAKFLKAAEKHGLIKLKDIRGESHVKSFNWKHRDMVEYKPYKVSQGKKDKGSTDAGNGSAAAGAAATGSQGHQQSAGNQIRVVDLFKPPNALKPLFDDVGAQTSSGYFTRHQTRQALEDYIKSRELIDPKSPRQVKLDHRLCDGLLTKEEYSKLALFPRDKLQARMQERMTLYTQLLIPGKEPVTKIGSPPVVDITCEKKMGNKVITRTAGLEKYGIDPNAIAKELRTICASSTAVDPIPGKKDAHSVLVQGHHVAAVTKLLEKHGLPPRLISVTDKTSKPKKK
ncbi:hypothetical protein GQ54DRAFT_293732 [Martensiomyces pterosporus]|nr:hypothetical protein GQ54DRAFT_293732 [Martensiomyces pterosporus]